MHTYACMHYRQSTCYTFLCWYLLAHITHFNHLKVLNNHSHSVLGLGHWDGNPRLPSHLPAAIAPFTDHMTFPQRIGNLIMKTMYETIPIVMGFETPFEVCSYEYLSILVFLNFLYFLETLVYISNKLHV